MKIEKEHKAASCYAKDLKPGDCFTLGSEYYMLIPRCWASTNEDKGDTVWYVKAARLRDGRMTCIGRERLVYPVKGKFVVEDC